MRVPARPALVLMLAAGLAGCGSSRNRPPSVTGTAKAGRALERAVRERDPTFALSARKLTRVDGHPGVELVGQETIAGVRRKVRSLHVYFAEAETVFDAYAPPDAFRDINRTTFIPLLKSIRLSRPA
ncbi:MAG: hypothetical protein E6G56_15775 [Actinobacteria bacterium]|nr:MAG: hypothetical protein E6G56_15775 [Actinomycetota bacterium]